MGENYHLLEYNFLFTGQVDLPAVLMLLRNKEFWKLCENMNHYIVSPIPTGHTTMHKPHAFFLPCFSIYSLLF